MKMIRGCFLFLMALFCFTSCYYDSEEALYPDLNNACDTSSVTYSGSILPIVNDNCLGCHSGSSAGGGVHIENYSDLAAIATNGKLMNVLNGVTVQMPPSGKIPSCSITKVEIWIRDGKLNN
jgi:hypothetical protein